MNRDETLTLNAQTFSEIITQKIIGSTESYRQSITLLLDDRFGDEVTTLTVTNFPQMNRFCGLLLPYLEDKIKLNSLNLLSYGEKAELLTDQTVTALLAALNTRDNVIELSLSNETIHSNFLSALEIFLSTHIHLETLELNIRDQMIPILAPMLASARNLKFLHLFCPDLSSESVDILAPILNQLPHLKVLKTQDNEMQKSENPAAHQSLIEFMKTIAFAKENYDKANAALSILLWKANDINTYGLENLENQYTEFREAATLARDMNFPNASQLFAQAKLRLEMTIIHFKFKQAKTSQDQLDLLETANHLLVSTLNDNEEVNMEFVEKAMSQFIAMIDTYPCDDLTPEITGTALVALENTALTFIDELSFSKNSQAKIAEVKFKILVPLYAAQFHYLMSEDATDKLEKMRAIVEDEALQDLVDAGLVRKANELLEECSDQPKRAIDFETSSTPLSPGNF